MNHTRRNHRGPGATAMILLAGTGVARAQDAGGPPPNPEPNGFVAFGAAVLPEYIGAEDLQPVPFIAGSIAYRGFQADLTGLGGKLDLVPSQRFAAGPVVSFEFGRDDDASNDVIARLPAVDIAIELGGFVRYQTLISRLKEGQASIEVQVRQDVAGGHEGLVVASEAALSFALTQSVRMALSATASWADDAFHDTYFDVDNAASEASGLPIFDAQSGLRDLGGALLMNYAFNRRWGVVGRLGYTRLVGDAADSPVVDLEGDANQLFAGAGVTWRF